MNRRTFTKSILTGIGAILSSRLLGNGLAPVEEKALLKTPANDFRGYVSGNGNTSQGMYSFCIGQGTPVYSVSNFAE